MREDRPLVGITLGDAAGIGPEVVVKALHHEAVHAACRPLVIGDARILGRARFATQGAQVRCVDGVAREGYTADAITLLDLHNLDPAEVAVGEVNATAGHAAVAYVLRAAELALAGEIDAVATAPLNKAAMRQAGYHYIGHTEILAEVTGTPRCTTMLATPGLRVTHVTRHVPFREIAARLTQARILETVQITHAGMRAMGYSAPRLAVAGLNPHNGDGGLLGREEIDIIAPAVAEARAQGITVEGPVPADSVFFRAIGGAYDAVVALYHDQGHIAVKTHGFERSITITLGLPIVRTSADHGTAFDIAGKGIANEESMVAAILEAARLARLDSR